MTTFEFQRLGWHPNAIVRMFDRIFDIYLRLLLIVTCFGKNFNGSRASEVAFLSETKLYSACCWNSVESHSKASSNEPLRTIKDVTGGNNCGGQELLLSRSDSTEKVQNTGVSCIL